MDRSNSLESRRNDVTNEKVSLLYVRLFHCLSSLLPFSSSSSSSSSKAGVCCRTRNERKYGLAWLYCPRKFLSRGSSSGFTTSSSSLRGVNSRHEIVKLANQIPSNGMDGWMDGFLGIILRELLEKR